MDAAQYIFVNAGLGMSQGKLGAQTGHAAVESYRRSKPALIDAWYEGGHYKKLVMEARDETHLLVIERYLNARGFRTSLVIDEGVTEVAQHTATALGVEIVDKDDLHVAKTFESFKLLPPAAPPQPSGVITLSGPARSDRFAAIRRAWDRARERNASDIVPTSALTDDAGRRRFQYHSTLAVHVANGVVVLDDALVVEEWGNKLVVDLNAALPRAEHLRL